MANFTDTWKLGIFKSWQGWTWMLGWSGRIVCSFYNVNVLDRTQDTRSMTFGAKGNWAFGFAQTTGCPNSPREKQTSKDVHLILILKFYQWEIFILNIHIQKKSFSQPLSHLSQPPNTNTQGHSDFFSSGSVKPWRELRDHTHYWKPRPSLTVKMMTYDLA